MYIGVCKDCIFDVAVVFLQTLKQECANLQAALDKFKAENTEAKVCTYFKDLFVCIDVRVCIHMNIIQQNLE